MEVIYTRQPTYNTVQLNKKLISVAFIIPSTCSRVLTLTTVYHHFQMALMIAYVFIVAATISGK